MGIVNNACPVVADDTPEDERNGGMNLKDKNKFYPIIYEEEVKNRMDDSHIKINGVC